MGAFTCRKSSVPKSRRGYSVAERPRSEPAPIFARAKPNPKSHRPKPVLLTPLIRERIGPKLNMIDRTDSGFGEFWQVRAISGPNSAALPTRLGVINAAVKTTRVKRHRVGHPEYGKRFLLRIEDQHRIRSCPGNDDSIFAESQRIELIYPQEIGIFGAPCFLAGAREFWSWQIPVLEFSSPGIQLSKVPAAGREPNIPVRAEIYAV